MVDAVRKQFVFTWQIENYSLCPLENTEWLESPGFKADNIGGSEWYISLYPRGEHKSVENFLACYLHRVKNDNNESTDFSLEIIGHDSKIIKKWEVENIVVTVDGWGWVEFLTVDELNKEMIMWNEDILTIRCCIMAEYKLTDQLAREITACNKIGVDKCYFKWFIEIPDSSCWEKSKDVLFSNKSQLRLTFAFINDDIEMSIRRMDEDCSKSKSISCKIFLNNLEGVEIESKSVNHLFTKGSVDICKFPTFFSKKDLQTRKDESIRSDTIILKCKVCASTAENWSEIKGIKYEVLPFEKTSALDDPVSTLLKDLRNMLKSEKNSDVKFRIENQTIPAHKSILSARSPVFSAMFDQDMLENQTGIIDIVDLDAKTLKIVLEFIYTGYVNELDSENAMKVLMAANKYQIPSLIEKCVVFLASHLSVETVCDVYSSADLIDSKRLKSIAIEFIEANSSKVLSSNSWSDWMELNVKLANEILFKLALDSSH